MHDSNIFIFHAYVFVVYQNTVHLMFIMTANIQSAARDSIQKRFKRKEVTIKTKRLQLLLSFFQAQSRCRIDEHSKNFRGLYARTPIARGVTLSCTTPAQRGAPPAQRTQTLPTPPLIF
jgi:hypothetical protein